jgi:hypothetical protein
MPRKNTALMSRCVLVTTCLVFQSAQVAHAQLTVPNAYETIPGTSTFLGPLANAGRTYQWLINANQLTSIVGDELTGISFRLPTSATAPWPAGGQSFANFDLYLSESVAPADRSLTFSNNIVGTQTQVRSGSLSIADSAYGFGTSPNSFGPVINFTPYVYNGGHLLVELRHTGVSGTSRSVDAIGTTTAGYATDFSACWTGSYTGTSGSQGNFSVIQFTTQPVPEPALITLISLSGLAVAARWRKRSTAQGESIS